MNKPLKFILISADWEKSSFLARKAVEEASRQLGLRFEERKEDWEFLTMHGAKDEFGGVDIPQVFIEFEGGMVKHVMTRVPLNSEGKPDLEAAVKTLVEGVKGGG